MLNITSAHKKNLLSVISVCIILAFALPLLQSNAVLYSTVFLKGIVFQILVEIMIIAWVILAFSNKEYRPKWKHPMIIALIVYFLVLLVTLPFSIDPAQSFWSTRRRMMGFVNILHYGLWFFILVSIHKTWRDWKPYLIWSNVICLIVGAIGLNELLRNPGAYRITSTLGNPDHLAAYILIHIFLALILFFKESSSNQRKIYGIFALFHTSLLFITAGRGALLALFLSLLFGGVLFCITKKKIWTFAMLVIAVLCAVTAFLWLRSPHGAVWGSTHLPFFAYRLAKDDPGNDRLQLWNISWQGIKEQPFFGWGLENFTVVFNKFFDPVRYPALIDGWYDRPHNQFIETLLTTGAIGSLASFALPGLACIMLCLTLRKKATVKEQMPIFLLLMMFGAYAIENFFAFDMPMSLMLFFTGLGLSIALVNTEEKIPFQKKEKEKETSHSLPILPILLTTMLGSVAIFFINIFPFWKAVQNTAAYVLLRQNKTYSQELFKKSLQLPLFINTELRLRLVDGIAEIYDGTLRPSSDFQPLVAFASAEMDKSLRDHPWEYKYYLAQATIARYLSAQDPKNFEKAKHILLTAIPLAPHRPEAYKEMGNIFMEEKKFTTALSFYTRSLHQELQSRSGETRFRMALAYASLAQFDQAFTAMHAANKSGYPIYQDPRLALRMADALQQGDKNLDVLAFMDALVHDTPNEPNFMSASAITHFKANDIELANNLIEQIKKINPTIAEETASKISLLPPVQVDKNQ